MKKPLKSTAQEPAEGLFVTWAKDDVAGMQRAVGQSYGGQGRSVVKRSVASNIYNDIAPGNVSIRDTFDRSDYDMFRPGEQTPYRIKDVIRDCMRAYSKIGIIRNVIDLMADFTTQGIDLVHPNERIETFYKEWFRKVGGKERSERFANYLYRTGNVVVKRQTAKLSAKNEDQMRRATADADIDIDETPKVVKREIPWTYRFQNPLSLVVLSEELAMFVDPSDFVFGVQVPMPILKQIKNPQGKHQKAMVQAIPDGILSELRGGSRMITLDPEKTSAYYYKRDDWSVWAEPMLNAILEDINLLRKMRLADLAALDGAISSIRVWKLGSLEHKILPTELAINRLAQMLMNNVGGGVMDLVWGPEIELLETSTEVYKFLGQTKYEPVLTAIYAGLGIPPTLTGAAGSTGGGFTNNFISLKTLTERLQYGRDVLKGFWDEEIRIVQKAMGFRFPATVRFDRMVLTDEAAEKALLIQLADRDLISVETLQERFGEDPAIEQVRIRREHRQRKAQQMPAKASPFHTADKDHELKKIVASSGSVTPSELGVQLDEKKPGQKSPLQMQADSKMNTKLAGKKPKGQPGQGRPKNKKDSKKRKQKRVTPRTSAAFIETFAWAETAQANISQLASKPFLKSIAKKNMRELTAKESSDFENFKFYALCAFEPGAQITEDSLKQVVGRKNALSVPSFVNELLETTVAKYIETNGKEPPIEVLRRFHAGTYAFWKGDFEETEEDDQELACAHGHFKNICSCGAVISQCRCTSDKEMVVVPNGCDDCREVQE